MRFPGHWDARGLDHFADGIGEDGDFLEAGGDGFNPIGRELEAVDGRVGKSEAGGSGDVELVSGDDPIGSFAEQPGGAAEPVDLGGAAGGASSSPAARARRATSRQ